MATSDAPPSYEQALGSSSSTSNAPAAAPSQHLDVPHNLSTEHRRSIEDEGRPLPPGWIRQYDHKTNHQFFVDTTAHPPRSIWSHPYDDETYLKSLSPENRERIEAENLKPHSRHDIIAADSDIENDDYHPGKPSKLERPIPSSSNSNSKFGRKLKDKLTGSTHEERAAERKRREEEEREIARRHQRIRIAMQQAFETGQPQFLLKDKDGNDVYMLPPNNQTFNQGGRYGYNPYNQQGPYQQPDGTRFVPYPAPSYPYNRPMYGYYGAGMGLPLMTGMLGGAMLGGLLF